MRKNAHVRNFHYSSLCTCINNEAILIRFKLYTSWSTKIKKEEGAAGEAVKKLFLKQKIKLHPALGPLSVAQYTYSLHIYTVFISYHHPIILL